MSLVTDFEAISIAAMTVLLIWGGLNILRGLKYYHAHNLIKRHFWRMNTWWGSMNFLLAVVTLSAIQLDWLTVSPATQLRVIAVNLALEVGYVAIGTTMVRLQAKQLTVRRFGWGLAVMMQGAFLVLFDSILLLLLHNAQT